MDINEYINKNYDGSKDWFVEETSKVEHWNRINNIINLKEYISGKHPILQREPFTWNGQIIEPRKIVLNYTNVIILFSVNFLLKNPVSLSSSDEKTLEQFKEVYKKGKYNRINWDILDKLLKFGEVYEYPYVDEKGKIRSKIIDPIDSYPIYNDKAELICFVEAYTVNNISHYIIYYLDSVEEWNDEGGQLKLIGEWNNPSGLPVVYKSNNELDSTTGRSDLEEYINVINQLEDLISKYTDAVYKFVCNPLPVVIGQKLNSEGAVSEHIVGAGLNLDDGADFRFANNQLDYKSFETIFQQLKQALYDISCTPSVSMNSMEISNISETSIRMLYSLALVKGSLYERYLKEGFEQRHEKIEELLRLQGIEGIDSDNIDIIFEYNIPQNQKEIIENLSTLNEMGSISLETILSNSPYIYNIQEELDRLKNQAGSNNE